MCAFISSYPIASTAIRSNHHRDQCHLSKSSFISYSTPSISYSNFVNNHLSSSTKQRQVRRSVSNTYTHKQINASAATNPSRPLIKVLNVITNLFPVWVFLGAVVALLYPPSFLWFQSGFIVPTLAVIMLGMGLTISPSSFAAVAQSPPRVLLGVTAQYTLMPLLARSLATIFSLPPAIAAGFILVGVCPGGAASNVVCLLAGADVALSVVLTLISTLLSVLSIPTLMSLLAGTLVPVAPFALFLSTAQVVLLPLIAGALAKQLFPKIVDTITQILPLISVIGIIFICGGIVAANAAALLKIGPRLVLAVGTLHATGGFFGYIVARLFRFPLQSARTISIEVMMQNSSLAVSLANAHFANPLTAVPGAISATMHSVFGSILAGCWRFADLQKSAKNETETNPQETVA